jgi:hypothetical protein
LHSLRCMNGAHWNSQKTLFAVEMVMDMNERQIALSVLETLREDLTYARLRNGSRVLDIADLRQYLYEQMDRVRTNAYVTAALYGNTSGRSGRAHP